MRTYKPWLDEELAELMRAEPELVAIADALTEAEAASVGLRPRRLRRRRWLLGAAAVAAAAIAALVSPWSGSRSGGLNERALAAIGTAAVLHVVIELPSDESIIDLATEETTPVRSSTEIWYDRARGLKHSVMREGDVVVGETLETPQRGYTESGPIYDCAWIAAHPAQAKKRRVSCNGTRGRNVARPKPALDTALTAFLDGYREAVARGAARRIHGGTFDGKQVVWLSFRLDGGRREDVALDPETYRPLYVRMPGGGWEYRIIAIESVPFEANDFRRPKIDPSAARIGSGGIFEKTTLALSRGSLARVVPNALWAGSSTSGLRLASIERDHLTSKFGTGEIRNGFGTRIVYGSTRKNGKPDYGRPYVTIAESDQLQPAYGWGFVRGRLPSAGKLLVPKRSRRGFAVVRGVYVSIWASDPELVVEAARRLRPVSR